MHSSYKKRLYTNALSLSTAVLLAFLAQGQVAADTVEAASPATPVENVLKPEETSTSPAQRQQILPLQQKRLLVQLAQEKALLPLQTQRVLQPK